MSVFGAGCRLLIQWNASAAGVTRASARGGCCVPSADQRRAGYRRCCSHRRAGWNRASGSCARGPILSCACRRTAAGEKEVVVESEEDSPALRKSVLIWLLRLGLAATEENTSERANIDRLIARLADEERNKVRAPLKDAMGQTQVEGRLAVDLSQSSSNCSSRYEYLHARSVLVSSVPT